MSVVLHISDTHFGSEQPAVVQALVQLAHHQKPDLVVLSGDITQRARPEQFSAARQFLGSLAAPALVLPGNHDIALFDLWARLTRPYARYSAAFGPLLEPVHQSHDLLVLGVNTTRAARHKHGEVSTAQIERVAHMLAQATPQQLRLVVVHQPVAVTRTSDVKNLLRGHAPALAAWAAAGADLVLGGHIHLPYTLAVPGLARPVWAVQAGTAVSTRLRAGLPNSVNLLRWDGSMSVESSIASEATRPATCRVEQWDYAVATAEFLMVKTTALQPSRT